jgi:hypothetical protein
MKDNLKLIFFTLFILEAITKKEMEELNFFHSKLFLLELIIYPSPILYRLFRDQKIIIIQINTYLKLQKNLHHKTLSDFENEQYFSFLQYIKKFYLIYSNTTISVKKRKPNYLAIKGLILTKYYLQSLTED